MKAVTGTAIPVPNSMGDGSSFVWTMSMSAKGSSLGGAFIMFLGCEGESMVARVQYVCMFVCIAFLWVGLDCVL